LLRRSLKRIERSLTEEDSSVDDVLREIVRVLARQAAREVFERQCELETGRDIRGNRP
jgi:hypothetical protein